MKKLILLTLIVLGTVSFARGGSARESVDGIGADNSLRDYEYSEKRDIVEPMEESINRMSRFSAYEFDLEVIAAEKNIQKYDEFHQELIMEEIGNNSDDRADRGI